MMFPTDDASVLLRLVECAQHVMGLQRHLERERVEQLPADIKTALDRPVEGERTVHEEAYLCAQLVLLSDRALCTFDKPRAIRVNRAIAAMLPDIQQDGHRAMLIRANGRPTP